MGRPIAVAFVVLLVATADAELRLSPQPSEYELDGVKLNQVAFADGNKKVTYQPPRGWTFSGSPTQLILHPPNKTQAEATITRTTLPAPGKFDEEALKKLVVQATEALPRGSEKITVISQEKNPLMINGKETYLVIFGYTLFGQAYNRSILFLNREKEQIHFQLVSSEADFKELHKVFLGSHYSWQNL